MRRLAMLVGGMFVALGCASTPQDVNREMALHLDADDPDAALSVLTSGREAYARKDQLLYALEEGMLLHYVGAWAESNAALERAKRAADANYTKSISRELGTYTVNDNTVPYYGHAYEISLIHVVAALNHAALGQLDSALVEFRQLDGLIRKRRVDRASGTFQDDAFGRYLGGIFYTEADQPDEAFISYKLALDAYHAHEGAYGVGRPKRLAEDSARVAAALGQWAMDELAQKLRVAPVVRPVDPSMGRLVLIHYNGRAPYKVQDTLNITVGEGWVYVNRIEGNSPSSQQVAKAQGAATGALSRESFQVAFPRTVRVLHRINGVRVSGDGLAGEVASEPVARFGATAERAFEDDVAWITTRAIARAALKYVLARIAEEAARESGGDAAGLATRIGLGIARNVSETADVRSWFTAPDEIDLVEAPLPAGTHALELSFVDASGALVERRSLTDVVIEPGRRTFRVVRTAD